MKVNVLFIGGGKRVSMVKRFKKAAKSLQLDLSIFAYELRPEVHIAPHIDAVITGKSFTDWTFPHLDELTYMYQIDIIIPFMDDALYLLAEYRDKLPFCVVSSPRIVDICNDKFLTATTFKEWGLKTPVFEFVYPAIAKARFGYGSRDQQVVSSSMELWDINRDKYIIQKFIRGTEYTVDCYVDRMGVVKGAVPRKRLLVSRGEVENSVTVEDEEIVERCHHILSHSGFFGPITLQFIRGEDGLYFIEANARFGGGVILSIEAGANYPKLILQEWLNQSVEQVTYKPNLLMLRSFRETFFESYNG